MLHYVISLLKFTLQQIQASSPIAWIKVEMNGYISTEVMQIASPETLRV